MKKIFVNLTVLAMLTFGSVAVMAQEQVAEAAGAEAQEVVADADASVPADNGSTVAEQPKTASSESGLSTSTTPAQPTPAQEQQGGGWSFWIMMIAIFVIFYFFMIRPQQKKQKELQKQRDALKKGDRVISAGGIYGIIKEVNETTFLIEVAKDVVIKMDKGSIYVAADDVHQAQEVADKK
jgi:preprotein translocase subunit YajC